MDGFLEYNYLSHYGILGMKWGIRRYQNADGSLTSAGRARYSSGTTSNSITKNRPTPRKKTVTDNSKGTYKRGKVNTKTSAKESAMNAGGGRYTPEYAKINERNVNGGRRGEYANVGSCNGISFYASDATLSSAKNANELLAMYGINAEELYLVTTLAQAKGIKSLTIDPAGYTPGIYTSLFKELRGKTDTAENADNQYTDTVFPAVNMPVAEGYGQEILTYPEQTGTMYNLGKEVGKAVAKGRKVVNSILKTIRNAVKNAINHSSEDGVMSFNEQNYLCHYGIKGMKWGIRRYQNPDGSLTAEGIQRYGSKNGLAKHINAENKKAEKLERDWLVKDYAAKRATKRLNKTTEKLERLQKKNAGKPISKKELKLMNRALDEAASSDILNAHAKSAKQKAEEHYNALVNEFGKENVAKLSDNAVKRGDAFVASALAGGLEGAAIAALVTNFDKPNNSYYGVRSDAKRLEKSTLKNSKGLVNWQITEKTTAQKSAEPSVKTVSNGKSKVRIENSGNEKEDKALANNISTINKNAVKTFVDTEFDYMQKLYPGKTKQQLYNSFEIDSISENGTVDIKAKEGVDLGYVGYPYVLMDRKTGKISRGAWDD